MSKDTYDLNDLPMFSPWPARLLGLEPWGQRSKSTEEIIREYDKEKWRPLLQRVRSSIDPVTVDEVDEWHHGSLPETLSSFEETLELLPPTVTHERYIELIRETLGKYLPAAALVELGAGYGSVVLKLGRKKSFREMPLVAGEFTKGGIALLRELARAEDREVRCGFFDLRSPSDTEISIPPDAIIFTSYATSCIPVLEDEFVLGLCRTRPRAVVHFEPCYEHCDTDSVLGLMRKRYLEINDYNRNLVTLLRTNAGRGKIEILEERPAAFGQSPVFAASVVAWAPRHWDR